MFEKNGIRHYNTSNPQYLHGDSADPSWGARSSFVRCLRMVLGWLHCATHESADYLSGSFAKKYHRGTYFCNTFFLRNSLESRRFQTFFAVYQHAKICMYQHKVSGRWVTWWGQEDVSWPTWGNESVTLQWYNKVVHRVHQSGYTQQIFRMYKISQIAD